MRIDINFSGFFHFLAGTDQDVVDMPEGKTLLDLVDLLRFKYPQVPLGDKNTRFAVNQKIADTAIVLQDGDHVMLFQILAGG